MFVDQEESSRLQLRLRPAEEVELDSDYSWKGEGRSYSSFFNTGSNKMKVYCAAVSNRITPIGDQ